MRHCYEFDRGGRRKWDGGVLKALDACEWISDVVIKKHDLDMHTVYFSDLSHSRLREDAQSTNDTFAPLGRFSKAHAFSLTTAP
jgi:hypothetical protein